MKENLSSCFGFSKVQDKMDIIREINQLSEKLDKMEKVASDAKTDIDSQDSCIGVNIPEDKRHVKNDLDVESYKKC